MAFISIIINTIYLGRGERWYKRKKPQLQIEILACLTVVGNLSKSKLQSCLKKYYYNDISRAVDALNENNYISLARLNYGAGRPQKYYKINERGLGLLLSDNPVPEKVWKALIGFCHHSKHTINRSMFERLFELFLNHYLNYSSKRGYFLQLELFNNLQDQWLRSCILGDHKIKLDQKVLEILSLNPQITFKELLKMTNEENEHSLRKSLSIYSPISHKPMIIDRDSYPDEGILNDEDSMYSGLLLHKTIIIKRNTVGEYKFELSLLGIMLVFTLIRYNDDGKLGQGLYHNELSIQEYYEKIAENYKEKLPLIFGKWYLLKGVFGCLAVYNFDIILDKKFRAIELQRPISERGNKEFYEAVDSLSATARREMMEIQSVGLQELFNYRAGTLYSDPSMTKMRPLIHKILDISALLSPIHYDPSSFIQTMLETTNDNNSNIELEGIQTISQSFEIEAIEKAFADLVSLYYFLNLQSENDLLNQLAEYSHAKVSECVNSLSNRYYPLSRRQIALSIFRQDNDIKDWFSDWIKDLLNHEREKAVAMERIRNEVGLSE